MANAWGGGDPVESTDLDPYELSCDFVVHQPLSITHIRVWTSDGEEPSVNRRARVWSPAGAQLGIATLPDDLPSGWTVHALDAPVARAAGQGFVASFSTGGRYGALPNALTAPVDSADGAVTARAAATAPNGNGSFGAPGVFPTTPSTTNAFYGIDVVYVLASVTPVVIPRLNVDPPAAATPHRFGLFTAATVLENVSPHALTGIEYEAVCSTRVDGYPAPCRPGDVLSRTKTPQRTTSIVNATPFALYAADSCVLGRDQALAQRQLRQRLANGEETAVERIVFSGELDQLPNLRRQAQILPGAARGLDEAVGELEQWLATTYGGVGVIHAPMAVANQAQHHALLSVAGPRALTVLGSAWAFGAGYLGTPPEDAPGPDTGALWLYATPPLTLRRSAVIEPADWSSGGFEAATNTGFLLAERMYVVDWPCGVAAVQTTLTRPGWVTPGGAAVELSTDPPPVDGDPAVDGDTRGGPG